MGWLNRSRTFITEVRAEMKKVTFPSQAEVISTSVVVVITSFIFGVFLFAADYVIAQLYRGMLNLLGA